MILEPDALANLPGYCGSAYNAAFPNITNVTRIDDVVYGVQTLENDPNISLYLDAGHSAWQAVGNIAEVLTAADVQQSPGFFLNVSNYQYEANSDDYGTWVSADRLRDVNEAQTPADALAAVATSVCHTPTGAFAARPIPRRHRPAAAPPGLERRRTGTNIATLAGAYNGVALTRTASGRTSHHGRPQHLGHRRKLRQRPRQHGAGAPLPGDVRHQPQRPRPGQHAELRGRALRPARQRHRQPRRQLVQPAKHQPRAQADG